MALRENGERIGSVSQYLSGLRAEGAEALPGDFTLHLSAARHKLAVHQLPFEHGWVLFLVRAAVTSDASEIRFHLRRGHILIRFSPSRSVQAVRIARAFLGPPETSDAFFQNLQTALWHLAVGDQYQFQVRPPGSSEGLEWKNGLEVVPIEASGSLEIDVKTGMAVHSAWRRVFRRTRMNASISKLLAERVWPSPIPVYLDGRRLDGLENCPHHGRAPMRLPVLMGDLPDSRGARFLLTHHRLVKGDTGYEPQLPYSSSTFWVDQGVQIQHRNCEPRRPAFSLALVLPLDGLRTDLSGFNLTDESLRTGRERVRTALRQLASHFQETTIDPEDLAAWSLKDEVREMLIFSKFCCLLLSPALLGGVTVGQGILLVGGGFLLPLISLTEQGRTVAIERQLGLFLEELNRLVTTWEPHVTGSTCRSTRACDPRGGS